MTVVVLTDVEVAERLQVSRRKTRYRRTVEVFQPLSDDLEAIRPKGQPLAPVATSPNGLPVNLGNWRRRIFDAACKAAGVEATPYDGRHTYATLLIHAGYPVPYVAAALGHRDATTALRHYAHVFDEARLSPSVPVADAIMDARAKAARGRLRVVAG